MKKLILITLLISTSAFAKTAKKQTVARNTGSGLGTNFVFDGSNLHGKYNYAFESNATVENEKKINSLLDVRTNFKDRMSEEKKRN